MTRHPILLLLTAFLLLLPGCLPASLGDATPDAAVVNVPANAQVPGAADLLHDRLADLDTGHDLVPRAGVEFLEVRRDVVGPRVAAGAARVARSSGADLAVTVGATTLRRELLSPERAPLERVTLQLEVVLIRASDASELARFRGPRLVDERFLDDDELPPLAQDPILARLTERSIASLAPRVAEEMAYLAINGSNGG